MEITASNAYSLITKILVTNLFVKRMDGGFSLNSGGIPNYLLFSTVSDTKAFLVTTDYEEWLKAFLQMDGAKVENNQVLTARPPTPQQRPPHLKNEPTTPSSALAPGFSFPDGTPMIRTREKKSWVIDGFSESDSFRSGELKLNHDLGLFVPDMDEAESPEYNGKSH